LDPNKRRASNRIRLQRWRARKRAEKAAAILEAKRLHRIELDNLRVARGLLPIKEAKAASLAKFRETQAALKEEIRTSWFGPPIDLEDAIRQREIESPNLDSYTVRQIVEGRERNCRSVSLHLNAFTLKHGVHLANQQRLVFHELVEQGVPLREAMERCAVEPFKPNAKLSGVAQSLDTLRRFSEAQEKWEIGDAIIDVLLGHAA
jgi:hypothetical protein